MPLVKYTANLISGSGTSAIELEPAKDGQPREIVLGGPAVDLSNAELEKLRYKYEFKLDEPEKAEAPKDAPVIEVPVEVQSPETPGAPDTSPTTLSTPDSGS